MKTHCLFPCSIIAVVLFETAGTAYAKPQPDRPNIILMMADDMGWGDPGFNGGIHVKTPQLDAMAAAGLKFNRFYSAAPVCSPTRGSCVTGRHPYRYGIYYANKGHMKPEELTLAELLKKLGYTTGHFGKWHLGTLTKTEKDSNRGGPNGVQNYSPPWDNGFDVCFSTEAKVPTWDPMFKPGTREPYGTYYWREDGAKETENLDGDDSRVIMDRVVPFLRGAIEQRKPFFAIVWFHTPHLPCVAGPEYLERYEGKKGAAYYGCITAMDDQIGRLRKELRELGVADNTIVTFCSDNGPEGGSSSPGSAGPFRGRKRSLFEGGVRVPGLLEWPARVKSGTTTDVLCVTSDYLPTILDVLGVEPIRDRPIDGISLVPLLDGEMKRRPKPIGFESGGQISLVDNRYKIIASGRGARKNKEKAETEGSSNGGRRFMLFDLIADPSETNDLAYKHPEIVKEMATQLEAWRESCKNSDSGNDY